MNSRAIPPKTNSIAVPLECYFYKMNDCCSEACKEVNDLSLEEQKALRRGKKASNKIFKKGRSEALKFKKSNRI